MTSGQDNDLAYSRMTAGLEVVKRHIALNVFFKRTCYE